MRWGRQMRRKPILAWRLWFTFEWVRPKGSCTDTDPLRPLMSSSVSPPPQTSPCPLVQYTSRHNKGCLKPSAEEREWNFQTHRERERRSAGERNGEITYFVFALNRKTRNVWRFLFALLISDVLRKFKHVVYLSICQIGQTGVSTLICASAERR